MGAMQRRKGRSFEQQVAIAYRALMPNRTVRRSLQAHRPYEPDVVVEGLPVWTECQDARHPTPEKKHQQAMRDVAKARERGKLDDVLPVVVWHRIRERDSWATFALDDLLRLLGQFIVPGMPSMLVTITFKDFLAALVVLDARVVALRNPSVAA